MLDTKNIHQLLTKCTIYNIHKHAPTRALSLSLSLSHTHTHRKILICLEMYIYIYIYIRGSLNKFIDNFFVWALLLIVHTSNSNPLRSNLSRLQCTCCTGATTSGRPHRSPLVRSCQWPSSQSLSSPQLSHNDCLWD